jgi:4,5-dihydroxyphthalate decarboxylase
MGLVRPPSGFSLKVLEVGMVPPRRDGLDRHVRMLRDREFDVAEVSLTSYILAKLRGAPLTAVPVFPRRLFSQNHIWVRPGIEGPTDLIGGRVAIWAFQVTLSVLARGDLQDFYGVPWRKIHWLTEHPEALPWVSKDSTLVERMPRGSSGMSMLMAGEVDAYIDPHPPRQLLEGGPKWKRLFTDRRDECVRHFERAGYFPIMHVLAMKKELADDYPRLPTELMEMWEDSKIQADEFYSDLNYTLLPFGRDAYDESRRSFGADLWPSGVASNRPNLQQFLGYMADQDLISTAIDVDSLFHPSVLQT